MTSINLLAQSGVYNLGLILRQHRRRALPSVVLDGLLLIGAYLLAYTVRATTAPLELQVGLPLIGVAAVATVIVFAAIGVYRRIWEQTSGHGIVILFTGVLLAFSLTMVVDMSVRPRPLPLSVIALANVLFFGAATSVRYRSRLIKGMSWRWDAVWNRQFPQPKTRVLIIGAGEAGQLLAWRLKYHAPHADYAVVAFVDDDLTKQGLFVENVPVAGTRHDIANLSASLKIDLIVIAISSIGGNDFRDLLHRCEVTNARIKVVPNLFAHMSDTAGTELVRDVQPEDLLGRGPIRWHEAIDLAPVTAKRVLVTGAAGSIGSELSRQMALYSPTELILVDNNESGLYDLAMDLGEKHPELTIIAVLADITDEQPLRSTFEKYRPQLVFHAAAYKHVPLLEQFPALAVINNIGGTRNVARLAQQLEAERFVLISTDKAVNPSSIMGASKRVCELVLHALAQSGGTTRFATVRFGNVLGSRGSVVPTFSRQIADGGPVTVTDPEMTRYFMTIPEAVNLVIHAACITEGDDIFFLQMGEVVRILDLAERMIRLRGLRPYHDIAIRFSGVRPGEKLHEELFSGDEIASPTAHPYITRLESLDTISSAEGSVTVEIDSLIDSACAGQSASLAQLTALIRRHTWHQVSAHIAHDHSRGADTTVDRHQRLAIH